MTIDQRIEAKLEELFPKIVAAIADKLGKKPNVRIETYPIKPTDRNNLPKKRYGVKINELPQDGVTYYIGADIGEGIGGSSDDSALSVVMKHSCTGKTKQVAWYANNEVDPIEFAGILDATGRFYNDAVLAPEVNRYESTLHELRRTYGYPNLYRWKTVDSINPLSTKLGWMTNVNSRQRLCDWFRRLIKTKMIEINDPKAKKDLAGWESGSSEYCHKDDHIQALMIAALIANEF